MIEESTIIRIYETNDKTIGVNLDVDSFCSPEDLNVLFSIKGMLTKINEDISKKIDTILIIER